jgi:tetratricopeptide (TPR) repeat protein
MSGTVNTTRLDQLRKLHAADPSDADVCYMIAQELGKGGEHAPAKEWYDRCLAADGAYCYAYFFKAISQNETGDRPGAVATLRQGLVHARASGHPKSISELSSLLEQLS